MAACNSERVSTCPVRILREVCVVASSRRAVPCLDFFVTHGKPRCVHERNRRRQRLSSYHCPGLSNWEHEPRSRRWLHCQRVALSAHIGGNYVPRHAHRDRPLYVSFGYAPASECSSTPRSERGRPGTWTAAPFCGISALKCGTFWCLLSSV